MRGPCGANANAMLWATSRDTPASRAAAIRFAVPSRRSRDVVANCFSIVRKFSRSGIDVSWCTIASGAAARTAVTTESRSSASPLNGSTPAARNASAVAEERARPATECPPEINSGTSCRPITPLAPATNTRMGRLP
jgi:hypothetical protein